MKTSTTLLLLYGIILISEVSGCHQGRDKDDDDDEFDDRRRRSVSRGPDARKDMSDYFTACLLRKNLPGAIPRMVSVVDFVLRDTKWYKASDQYFCEGQKDTVGCWNSVSDLLIDWDSIMLGPVRECILSYGINPEKGVNTFSGGFRNKRQAEGFDSTDRSCPGVSDSVYGTCVTSQVNDTIAYPSFVNFHWESIAIFVREHMSRCGVEEFVQHWDGKTAYRRKCGFHRYRGPNGERVETAQEQCLPFLLDEVVKEESPLKPEIEFCNELYRNTSSTDDFVEDPGTVLIEDPVDPEDEFIKYGPRGKHHGADILGNCAHDAIYTGWYDNKDNATGDQELLVELRAANPGEICAKPTGIQMRVSRNDEPYYSSGNNFKDMAPDVGLDCRNSMQHGGKKCKNFKVRFCCLGKTSSGHTGQNRGTGNVPVVGGPSIPRTVDTVGTCGPRDKWGPWKNIDSKQGDGGDFEYARGYGQSGCTPVAVQGRIRGTNRPYTEARNNLRIDDPTGIVCSDDMQPKERPCVDFEVRFCCRDGKGASSTTQSSNPKFIRPR